VHRGLDEKKPSLPKFGPGFNDQWDARQCRPLAEMPVSHDLHQKKLNQSLNGLKNST